MYIYIQIFICIYIYIYLFIDTYIYMYIYSDVDADTELPGSLSISPALPCSHSLYRDFSLARLIYTHTHIHTHKNTNKHFIVFLPSLSLWFLL